MYYSAGTYESFAPPEKPQGVDNKSAYIIGTGLAGLTAAFYLVRDGQMKGERIHLLEKLDLAGGSCDGRKDVTKGYYMRGGREMDNHFEVMWDTFRDVPSIETPDVSVLDEYYCPAGKLLEHQLLAVLADDVRLPKVVQRPGNEALPLPVCPSHRWPARLQRPALYQV